jgi:hypothetical protein
VTGVNIGTAGREKSVLSAESLKTPRRTEKEGQKKGSGTNSQMARRVLRGLKKGVRNQ